MSRLKDLRKHVDAELDRMPDPEKRISAAAHLYGVSLAATMLAKRRGLDPELASMAAMLHDIGKLEELSPFPMNDYTDDGQLLGHIMIGAEEVGIHIRAIPDFPPMLASEVKHCILAHHGELEYGSPKKPALPEAVALSHADNLDAKLETLKEAFVKVPDGNTDWIGFNRFFESNLRKSSR